MNSFTNLSSLCAGEVNSGKSVLVDKLCQASKTRNLVAGQNLSGCCLEYRYFDVRDEETDGTCMHELLASAAHGIPM